MSYSDQIAVPPLDSINTGLHSPHVEFMLTNFGRPGALSDDCSDPVPSLEQRILRGVRVAPNIEKPGLREAVLSVQEIFKEVKQANLPLYEQVKCDGFLCVRHVRHKPTIYSNHSWGAAIDLYFGDDVVPQGTHRCHRGNLALYPFFHRHGWYWGAEFPDDRIDTMHFEMSREALEAIPHIRGTHD